ncbi:MAG: hypothetical protein MOIL_01150 [Candidatus Methanolliviera sp. GoM_oil]|nr:MAG: hypothetical protein MOIL_01150 [Candidatus Methanolliviera sp. GoM_oil]
MTEENLWAAFAGETDTAMYLKQLQIVARES